LLKAFKHAGFGVAVVRIHVVVRDSAGCSANRWQDGVSWGLTVQQSDPLLELSTTVEVTPEGGQLMLGDILRWCDLHVKGLRRSQRRTLAYLTAGLIEGGVAGVAAIGRAMPGAAFVKHCIKRADRFLGNSRIDPAALSKALLEWAARRDGKLVLAMDWTDLPNDKKMLTLAIPTRGRAIPVHSRVVDLKVMYKSQNNLEEGLIREMLVLLPVGIKVVIVADRGFGRTSLMAELKRLGVSFVLRVQDQVVIRHGGRRYLLRQLTPRRGQTLGLRQVQYRDERSVDVNLVLTWRHRMKEPWLLATDLEERPAEIIGYYGSRMQIEESFRDAKSIRWGFRLRHVRLSTCERYQRLMMVVGLAYLFLMAAGAQAERDKRHRRLMANTSRKRTLSWLTVGRHLIRTYRRRLASCIRALQAELATA
jgi:hypothetical protein